MKVAHVEYCTCDRCGVSGFVRSDAESGDDLPLPVGWTEITVTRVVPAREAAHYAEVRAEAQQRFDAELEAAPPEVQEAYKNADAVSSALQAVTIQLLASTEDTPIALDDVALHLCPTCAGTVNIHEALVAAWS